MIKNILSKLKTFFKENGLFLITCFILLFILFGRLPYDVNMPGGIIDLSNRVKVNDKETETTGSFNMAYVSVVQGSIPHILISFIHPDWDITPSDSGIPNETIEDVNRRGKINLEGSKNYATVAAMDAAGIEYELKDKVNYIYYVDPKANTDLRVGDQLLTFNGNVIHDVKKISEEVQKLNDGDKVEFTILRDGKEKKAKAIIFTEDKKKFIGISSVTHFSIESDAKVDIKSKMSESGPSGGLMMSLMVYNALTNQDLTQGMKVVGTGTINLDGTVGAIGGVKYKLMGAVKNKADIFLVPEENYEEALKVKKEKDYDIELVSVKTLKDAIKYLEDM